MGPRHRPWGFSRVMTGRIIRDGMPGQSERQTQGADHDAAGRKRLPACGAKRRLISRRAWAAHAAAAARRRRGDRIAGWMRQAGSTMLVVHGVLVA
jgi:hypothetical protein